MSIKTPNYVLTETYKISVGLFQEEELEAGSFVRPVDVTYLPDHIKESVDYRWFDSDREIFAYTRYGIVCIPKRVVRKV